MVDFELLYKNIYEISNPELVKIKNNNKKLRFKKLGLPAIVFFILLYIWSKTQLYILFLLIAPVFFYLFITIISVLASQSSKIEEVFNEKVIPQLVSGYDVNLKYKSSIGLEEKVYVDGFWENYDEYRSNDMISGEKNGYSVDMARVDTIVNIRNSDGEEKHRKIFGGTAAVTSIHKNLKGITRISSDKGALSKIFDDSQRIEMDSSEFEQYFDVYSDNKIETMQILTSDFMEIMIEYVRKTGINLEMTLLDNKFYIRFTKYLFNFMDLDHDKLKDSFETIDSMYKVMFDLLNIIEKIEL